jgi:beta-lactamase superfamily II metal-dependent hydrolase
MPLLPDTGVVRGIDVDIIAPPPGELFSETNDNSVAILLTYGTARVMLAGDAEAKEEEYVAEGLIYRASERHQGSQVQNFLT